MVDLVPHSVCWQSAYDLQAGIIENALKPNLVCIHHIGSTAIPGILAKPIIDILVEVKDIEAVDACAPEMQAAGYEVKGEYGIPGRRYFRLSDHKNVRTHHVHVFGVGHHDAIRHLVFRDYMRAHPDKAEAYSKLKSSLADLSGQAYQEAKSAFVEKMQAEGLAWVANQELVANRR